MIQLNLLPDVKIQYIKTKRTKRLVFLGSTLAGAVSVAILILLFAVVNIVQKQQLKSVNNDISNYSVQLNNVPDLSKILTIQNQLNSLTELHDNKVVATRLFGYLSKLTPSKAKISKLDVDFSADTISFTGTADTLTTVNKFADTLKFTNYKTDSQTDSPNAFSGVVLTSFALNDKGVSFQLDATFDKAIFDSANNVTLVVPKIITTRSETEKPDNLFQTQGAGTNP